MKDYTAGYKAADFLPHICSLSAVRLGMDDIFNAPDGYIIASWDMANITKHFLLNEDPHSTKPFGIRVVERAWMLEINRPEPHLEREIATGGWWLHFIRAGFISVKYRKRINSILGRAIVLFGESEAFGKDAEQIALRTQIETLLGMRIEEFIRIVFGIFATQLKNHGIITIKNILGSSDPKMQEIMEPSKVARVLELLSITPEGFRDFASRKLPAGLDAYWLNPLFSYPIIKEKDGEQIFIPITSLLMQRATTGLYHMILRELEKKGGKESLIFRDSFGKHIFEPYVGLHMAQAIPSEKQRRGMKYCDPQRPSQQISDVDVLGWDAEGIIFVETTLLTASLETQLAVSTKSVTDYVRKLSDKVRQLHKHHKHSGLIKKDVGISEVLPHHCVLVTFQELPMPNLLIRYLLELELNGELGTDFIYHIACIDDWEHLCSSSKKYGIPLSRLLSEKTGEVPTGYDLMQWECIKDSVFAKIELNMPDPEKEKAGKKPPQWDITNTAFSEFTDFLMRRFGKEAIGSEMLDEAQNRMWVEMGIDILEERREERAMQDGQN
ncbi:MAG: hypothetical protein PHZ00_00450 [Candidatus Peribacteraceae bacterium]|nr:hypothetical protein [Candidatus Peribacteraceae bacterium]